MSTPQDVYTLCTQGRWQEALAEAWSLPPSCHYDSNLQPLGVDPCELVFRACRHAVQEAERGAQAAEASLKWVNGLLATDAPPNVLIYHNDGSDDTWCQPHRALAVRAHLLCARLAIAALIAQQSAGTHTCEKLLTAAWDVARIPGSARAVSTREAWRAGADMGVRVDQLSSLAQELPTEHWTSGNASTAVLADRALCLLVEHRSELPVPEQPAFGIGFLRDLAKRLIDGQPRAAAREGTESTAPFALVFTSRTYGNGPAHQEEKALIAEFVLERLEDGHGELYIAPEQALLPMDSDFRQLFTEAPLGVGRLLQGADGSPDVRLKIRRRDGEPMESPLIGNSASGAAAWGLYFLLTGKASDKEIIVLAQVDRRGWLTELGEEGIAVKVGAIARDGGFDTIVVASQRDADTAQQTLNALGVPPDELRVGTPECLLSSDSSSASARNA